MSMKILKKYELSDIYNIPEIMEDEIPFPYNISAQDDVLELLSPIELSKRNDGIRNYWVIATPTKYFQNPNLRLLIKTWNNHIHDALIKKFYEPTYKLLILTFVLINFVSIFLLSTMFNFSIFQMITSFIALNLVLAYFKPKIINHFVNLDITDYMNKIINNTTNRYRRYTNGDTSLMRIIDPIHIDLDLSAKEEKTDIIENKFEFKEFLEKLNNFKTNNSKILNSVKEIKLIIINLKNYIKNNPKQLNNILFLNDLNKITVFNKDIVDIMQLSTPKTDSETIKDIISILENYVFIYKHYQSSLTESVDLNDKVKLELIKNNVKVHLNYLNICKND